MKAQRYYDGTSLETCVIRVTERQTIRGIDIPVRGGGVKTDQAGQIITTCWRNVPEGPEIRVMSRCRPAQTKTSLR